MAKINNYRSRITIQKQTYTPNGFGGFTQTWNTVATVWANVIFLTGKESIQYKQVYPEVQAKIYIRYRSDITSDYRILYKNTYYNILSIIDIDNMQDEFEIMVGSVPSE